MTLSPLPTSSGEVVGSATAIHRSYASLVRCGSQSGNLHCFSEVLKSRFSRHGRGVSVLSIALSLTHPAPRSPRRQVSGCEVRFIAGKSPCLRLSFSLSIHRLSQPGRVAQVISRSLCTTPVVKMQLKTSLVLSALLAGLAAAHAQNGHNDYNGPSDQSEPATEHSSQHPTDYSSEHYYPQATTGVPAIFPTSGYANHTSGHYNTTVTSSQYTSSTSDAERPSTTRPLNTPTSINSAGRSQFGLAVFGLAVAAGLGL
ncbi:hypothetical protein BT67DRAFT_258174 [Trichocladium antarcticum]|uniref:Uncharacterized protein n=1 Tax=Trichocladium antarcticum TaxID=1450529 RepID=A0AAN6ZES3_9PEZI|nr:hypothetical protein BT67DRAFT_258174 [Trichocladium antarcticum]